MQKGGASNTTPGPAAYERGSRMLRLPERKKMALYVKGGDLEEIRRIEPSRIVVFDTETTGTDKERDEILQISMIDGTGAVLLSTYVKPTHTDAWPEAEAINKIGPAMVADAPTFDEIRARVSEIIRSADLLVGYNLSFDLGFIRAAGVSKRQKTLTFDVMKEFAPVAGEWSDWKHDWKWQRLSSCAAHYGYTFSAHDALEDTKATLHCFQSMLNDNSYGGYLSIQNRSFNPYEARQRALAAAAPKPVRDDSKKVFITGIALSIGKGLLVAFILYLIAQLAANGGLGFIIGATLGVAAVIMVFGRRRKQ